MKMKRTEKIKKISSLVKINIMKKSEGKKPSTLGLGMRPGRGARVRIEGRLALGAKHRIIKKRRCLN